MSLDGQEARNKSPHVKTRKAWLPEKRKIAESLNFNPDKLTRAQFQEVERVYRTKTGLKGRWRQIDF